MISSLLHNAAQSASMFDRIQTQGTRIIADHYPEAFQWATSKLLLLEKRFDDDQKDDGDHDVNPDVDTIWTRTGEFSQEWNMDDESIIITHSRTSKSEGEEAQRVAPILDADELDFDLDKREREEVKMLKERVFEEMKERIQIRKRWGDVAKELVKEHKKRRRKSKCKKKKTQQGFNAKKYIPRPYFGEANPLLTSLEEFYVKFDLVVADLEDRQNLIEIEEFKQLVIQDLSDRSEALCEFKQRLPVVLQELMEKVVIHDLKHDGLLPNKPKRIKPLLCDEWIELAEDEPIADEADWIVCDN